MCSIVAQLKDGVLRVIDEIWMGRATTPEVCEQFLEKYPNHRSGVVVYGDASGGNRQTTGSSDYEMVRQALAKGGYRSASYKVPRANPEVRERVNLVNAMLRSAKNETRVFIDRSAGVDSGPGTGAIQAGQLRGRQGKGRAENAHVRRAGIPDLAGVPAAGRGRREAKSIV